MIRRDAVLRWYTARTVSASRLEPITRQQRPLVSHMYFLFSLSCERALNLQPLKSLFLCEVLQAEGVHRCCCSCTAADVQGQTHTRWGSPQQGLEKKAEKLQSSTPGPDSGGLACYPCCLFHPAWC